MPLTSVANILGYSASTPSASNFRRGTQVMFLDVLKPPTGAAISGTAVSTTDSTTVKCPAKDTWMRNTFIRESGVLTNYKDVMTLASRTVEK